MLLPLSSLQLFVPLAATMRNGAFDAAPAMMRIGAPRAMARRVWSVAACPLLSAAAARCRAGDVAARGEARGVARGLVGRGLPDVDRAGGELLQHAVGGAGDDRVDA